KKFWQMNRTVKGASKAKPPETIDHKDFAANYYPTLVNDIAAAKAYLDRRNDLNKDVNSSNLIVIGAGEGATLGAMWMASEFHRSRSPSGFAANLDEPEGKDLICAVWLTISPTLAGFQQSGLRGWLTSVASGKKNKVPMLLVYGKNDQNGQTVALNYLRSIVGQSYQLDKKPTEKGMELTRTFGIPGTNLTGSKLLN